MHGDPSTLMRILKHLTLMSHIRQITTLLGYGKPQVLEVFKNTLPMRLYWVLFPIEDLRLAAETGKRILPKEKIDM